MKLKCLLPFAHLEISEAGNILCCCWGKYGYLGDLKKHSIEQIWNNRKFRQLRKNIYENNFYKNCDVKTCNILLSNKSWDFKALQKLKLPPALIKDIKHKKTSLSTPPLKITISDIGTCNLDCKMCFRNLVAEDKYFSKKLIKQILPNFIEKYKKYNLIIKLTGNGDPFFRKETREFLQNFKVKKYPKVEFELLTNGSLLTPKMWQTVRHNRIKEINISIDAACKKTYEKIRKGGNWDKLMKNLLFISRLRKNKKIKYFYINMVVMKSNYQEMVDFVKLGQKLGCDEVNFQRILGLHNLEENIFDYPDQKILKKIAQNLNDPIFKHAGKVKINTLQLQSCLNNRLAFHKNIKIYFNSYYCLLKNLIKNWLYIRR